MTGHRNLVAHLASFSRQAGEQPATPDAEAEAPKVYEPWKRPIGLVVFIVVWFAIAVYDIYLADALYGPQNSPTVHLGPSSTYSLEVQDLTLRIVLQVISFVQLLVIYGLWKGSPWAYFAGLGVSAFLFLTFGSIFALYYFAPVRIGLRTLSLYGNFALIVGFTVLTWVYLSRPKIKGYLTRWV